MTIASSCTPWLWGHYNQQLFSLSGWILILGIIKLTTSYGSSRYIFTFFFFIGNVFWLFSLIWTNYGIRLKFLWKIFHKCRSLITIVIIFSGPIRQWDWRMQSSLKQLILHSKCPKEYMNLGFQGKLALPFIKKWP